VKSTYIVRSACTASQKSDYIEGRTEERSLEVRSASQMVVERRCDSRDREKFIPRALFRARFTFFRGGSLSQNCFFLLMRGLITKIDDRARDV
jgi:hypothetical protein